MKRICLALSTLMLASCATTAPRSITLDWETKPTPGFQQRIEAIDAELRQRFGIERGQTAVGVLDLKSGRLAMIDPDRIEYAASLAKVGILFAWFQLHPDAALSMDAQTKHELALMIRSSSNEMATKYSRLMGLHEMQDALNAAGFYDASRGGGIWMGKHYGPNSERIGDPVADHSHAVTVRQLLRFYLLLDQRKLVSPEASEAMLEIFAMPDIPHDDVKFVRALAGRNLTILRKLGTWRTWLHDSAIVSGPDRRYVLVGLTNHERGDEYLEGLAVAVDEVMGR
jgi:beta-lactamase class A